MSKNNDAKAPAKVVSMASIATLKISPENDLFAMNRQEPKSIWGPSIKDVGIFYGKSGVSNFDVAIY